MFSYLISFPTELLARFRAQYVYGDEEPKPWGHEALRIADSCKGLGEVESNNESNWLDEIRRGGPGGAWCAVFMSECIEQGWARRNGRSTWNSMAEHERQLCPVKRSHGARKLFRRVGKAGRFLDAPKVGSIAAWARGREGWQGHVGIVSRVEGDRWWVVEGNIGPFPAEVTEREVTKRKRCLGWAELPG